MSNNLMSLEAWGKIADLRRRRRVAVSLQLTTTQLIARIDKDIYKLTHKTKSTNGDPR